MTDNVMTVRTQEDSPSASGSSEPVLRASDVCVRFGGLKALDHVDLAVPSKSVVGLVGPNGAGKSTLFNVLSGFLRPQEGRVEMNGRDISRKSVHARARAGMARTFQHPELFNEMTVREHVVLAHRLRTERSRLWSDLVLTRGLRPNRPERDDPSDTASVDSLLSALDLAADGERMAEGLPLGVARRVELARALAFQPSILLLDEPSSGLDTAETVQFTEVLLTVARDHQVSVVMVEHDVDLILRISSLVYVLDFGKVIAHGTPSQVRTDPAVKAAYLGEDPTIDGSDTHA
jgi:ABC-type branched-subunit amino acid transport system ATPase component